MSFKDEERNKAIELVQKLFRLGSSSNEHEALLAIEKARAIIDKYDLSMAQIDEAEVKITEMSVIDGRWEEPQKDYEVRFGARWPRWKQNLCYHIARNNKCGHFIKRFNGDRMQLIVVGTETDIKIVEYMFIYLVRQVKTFTTNYAIGYRSSYGGSADEKVKDSYRLGVVRTLSRRLVEIDASANTTMKMTSTGTDLMIVKNAELRKYMDNMNLRDSKSRGMRVFGDHYANGLSDGNKIPINKGINSALGVKALR